MYPFFSLSLRYVVLILSSILLMYVFLSPTILFSSILLMYVYFLSLYTCFLLFVCNLLFLFHTKMP